MMRGVHDGLRGDDGGMLTLGRQPSQAKCAPVGSNLLTKPSAVDRLSIRWAALLLYLAPDADGFTKELSEALLLPLTQEFE
jgi:hypothetical protein